MTIEAGERQALALSRERPARTQNGYAMLLVLLVALIGAAFGVARLNQGDIDTGVGLLAAKVFLALFVAPGFYLLQPNQAAAILLFGAYRGTDRRTGLRWVLPWMTRTKISTRVHNVTSERLKVNDLARQSDRDRVQRGLARHGYGAGPVRRRRLHQVRVRSDRKRRATIGARYPYDDIEHQETTLRGNADIINGELAHELQDRVAVAGITIDECRLTHLAYAQEIAQAMLRRQQAEAVIAARQKLVTGAVTMVETALQMLSEKDVVHLDDERKAAMVSNLMVVLCSERDTQPVVNAGTLYQ
jgi:hypothetical protein